MNLIYKCECVCMCKCVYVCVCVCICGSLVYCDTVDEKIENARKPLFPFKTFILLKIILTYIYEWMDEWNKDGMTKYRKKAKRIKHLMIFQMFSSCSSPDS